MRRRIPLALTAVLLSAQIFRLPALLDVAAGTAPDSVALHYPLGHLLFAPVTLLADWLNGGSRAELIGFLLWALLAYAVLRLVAVRLSLWRETLYAAAFVLGLIAFVAWVVYLPRTIPRLQASSDDALIFDVHSHTSSSRDGRGGFGVAASARWHERAGFHAAFVTDHNVMSDWQQWSRERPARAVRLLPGEELSLRGLHVVVLGNRTRIDNEPWNDDWDSTLALLTRLTSSPSHPYLIASLPEYWRHHWGPDIGAMVAAGIEGFEIWTTSPKAMEVPDSARREVIARAMLERRGLFGATDMHGIGHTATVWNVAREPGWRALNDTTLTDVLITRFRSGGERHRVIAMRRWLPQSRAGSLLAVPLGMLTALRTASVYHAAALLFWIWLVPVARHLRTRRSYRIRPAGDSVDHIRPSESASG